jgi:hypothetical protein
MEVEPPSVELAKRHWFLTYEEIQSAVITKQIPTRATLTSHDGRQIELKERWDSELITKDSRDVLLNVLHSISQD